MDRASWLLKALHEASGQVQEALLAARPPPGDTGPLNWPGNWPRTSDRRAGTWSRSCAAATIWRCTRPEWLTTSADATDVEELAWEYARARRDTCGLLWGLPSAYLSRRAQHPFRGDVSLEDLLVALHERDIETMQALQRLQTRAPSDAHNARPA